VTLPLLTQTSHKVAQLAGVGVEYYARLERGNFTGVSDSVLDALARALHLDEAERAHLYDLARTAGPAARKRRRPAPQRVRPNVQRLLDAMTEAPAVVMNGRADVLATNQLGRALFAPVFAGQVRPPNFARFNFPDPRALELWADWNRAADDTFALLNAQAGRDPYDKTLTDLIGAARSSAPGGPRTTYACTAPESSSSDTRSSASCT
jgi:transcriptional regulator with XRE-family HTH domain